MRGTQSSPAAIAAGGPATARTCAGAWRNASLSSLGPLACHDGAGLGRATERRGEGA
jgi:hypothetical protein